MIRMAVENLVDLSNILPLEENAQFPSSNLKDPRRAKIYRVESNTAELVFDFGTPQSFNSFYCVPAPLASFGFTTLRLQLSNSNAWSGTPIDVTLPANIDGFLSHEIETPFDYRFAKITLTNISNFCELSKVFMGERVTGPAFQFTYPLDVKSDNMAVISKNKFGQRFIDETDRVKTISARIENLNEAEMDEAQNFFDMASITRPIWISFEECFPLVNTKKVSGYYYLEDDISPQLKIGNFWGFSLKLREGK